MSFGSFQRSCASCSGAPLAAACALLIEAARLKQTLPGRAEILGVVPILRRAAWLPAFAPRPALPAPGA